MDFASAEDGNEVSAVACVKLLVLLLVLLVNHHAQKWQVRCSKWQVHARQGFWLGRGTN